MAAQSATFWIIAGLIAALSGLALTLALWRRRSAAPSLSTQSADVGVYRDQLAEIERDMARGVLGQEEAARVRLEISRRLLDADRAHRATLRDGPLPRLSGLAIGAFVLLGTVLIYVQLGAPHYGDLPLGKRLTQAEELRANRPTQSDVEARAKRPKTPSASPEHLELMEKLRLAMKDRPRDLEGHQLLARNEAALGNYSAAARAQNQLVMIKGASAIAQDFSNLAELLILATGGYVSPEAERVLGEALRRDPQNGPARYYFGLMFAQNDRADRAFEFWRPLVENGPKDAPFTQAARANILSAAALAGITYDLPEMAPGVLPGPSSADIDAAADMNETERQEMIRGMVERLSDRLASEGGAAADWARLIGALSVLGQTERAAAIRDEARALFANHPDDLAQIEAAAQAAGITE